MTERAPMGRIYGVQQKTGRVEEGKTFTEDGEVCARIREDGEPGAQCSDEKGDLRKLAQAVNAIQP